MHAEYQIQQHDYTRAGEASAEIRRTLRQLGVDSATIRRVSVASYEVEMNLVIHSLGGTLRMDVDGSGIRLTVQDKGPGIPDVEKALSEGYSTADDVARDLGFGAGMGLPNMRRNADVFEIDSEVGKGTSIRMMFRLPEA